MANVGNFPAGTQEGDVAEVVAEGWFDNFIFLGRVLKIRAYCPVDLIVTDSDGNAISKDATEIPGATYAELDLDGDGDLDDEVTIPGPILGDYSIEIIAEPGADPNETVTLEVEDNGKTMILLDEVRIGDLPVEPVVVVVTDETVVRRVEIDIKPGSSPNSINLGSHGVIPVAILTTEQFDATTVDPDTVELAGATIAIRGNGKRYLSSQEDVDGDGDIDLVLHVETENLTLETGATDAVLTGETYGGDPITGSDEMVIVNE